MPYAVRGYFENGGRDRVDRSRRGDRAPSRTARRGHADGLALPATQFLDHGREPGDVGERSRVTITLPRPDGDRDIRRSTSGARRRRRGRRLSRAARPTSSSSASPGESRLIRLGSSRIAARRRRRARSRSSTRRAHQGGLAEAAAPGDEYLDAVDAARRGSGGRRSSRSRTSTNSSTTSPPARCLASRPRRARTLHDRLVLVDLPSRAPSRWQVDQIEAWVAATLGRGQTDVDGAARWWRSAALYHPWVRVADPLGGAASPIRDISPSGHVAGVISQLDRDRGAHSTPGERPSPGRARSARRLRRTTSTPLLNAGGVDLLRCVPALGFSVWGGRTLDRTDGASLRRASPPDPSPGARDPARRRAARVRHERPGAVVHVRPRDHGGPARRVARRRARGRAPRGGVRGHLRRDDEPARGDRRRALRLPDRRSRPRSRWSSSCSASRSTPTERSRCCREAARRITSPQRRSSKIRCPRSTSSSASIRATHTCRRRRRR